MFFLGDTTETSSGQEAEVLGREPTWKKLGWRKLVVKEKIEYKIGFTEELTVALDLKLTSRTEKGVHSTHGSNMYKSRSVSSSLMITYVFAIDDL